MEIMTGAQLRALRLGMGLEQTKLARKLGVCAATVSRWENNHRAVPGPVAVAVKALAKEG